jgi:hypothetical protein
VIGSKKTEPFPHVAQLADKMPIPFGVGIGDFLAVGKLIGQIAIELQEVSDHPIILVAIELISFRRTVKQPRNTNLSFWNLKHSAAHFTSWKTSNLQSMSSFSLMPSEQPPSHASDHWRSFWPRSRNLKVD